MEKTLVTATPGFVIGEGKSITMTIDSANIAADSNGKKIIYPGNVLGVAAPFARTKKARIAVMSTLLTALTGSSNDVLFTSKNKYADNSLSIAFIDPSANSAVLHVDFDYGASTIKIMLATSGAGAITTTANDIIALVNGNVLLKDMITAALPSGETGATAVTAMSATAMSGGYKAFGYALNEVDVTNGDKEISVLFDGVVDTTVTAIDGIRQI